MINTMSIKRFLFAAAVAVLFWSPSSAQEKAVVYHDASAFPLYGKCVEATSARYERLPKEFEGVVRKSMWDLGRNSAGLYIRFRSNSTQIRARWRSLSPRQYMPHMADVGDSGLDLYILCDVGAYNCTYNMYGHEVPMSPDDHYMDLKRTIAAVGGKAKRITVIMPLLYGGRQHRRSARESLDCALMLQELNRMGVNNIITFDAHDPRVVNAIPEGGFESVMPSYQIFKALLKRRKDLKLDKDHLMIVSPDEGALDRNIFYASVLGVDMGMFYKRRDYTRIVNGRNPIVAHEYMGKEVNGKDVFVADDILSSGESMIEVAHRLKELGANRIFSAVTFPLFTNGLELYQKSYDEGLIDGVISTNLTYRTPELQAAPWFIEADMSKYISYIIATLNHDRSLSKLLSPYDRVHNLMNRYKQEQEQG